MMPRRVLLALIALLSGCVSLKQPAPEIHDYRLDYTPPPIDAAPLPLVLGITPLRVAAVYDHQPMIYREDAHTVGSYFYSRWSANPGNLVADLLARDFSESGAYRAVQQGPSLLPIDYQLRGEIEEIEERIDENGCHAHLRLRMLLVRAIGGPADPVQLRKTYSGDEPCACNDSRAMVAAMSRTLERISAELQRDVYEMVKAPAPEPHPAKARK